MAGKIFVNYRRDDVRADARDIAGRLSCTFGRRNVFMDVDNLIAGQRFDQQLETSLAQCDIFIAVIGNKWGDILAQRQAVNEQDFVVDEIAAAIARGIPVIPVLVDGAPLPQAIALPTSIAALPLYQSHEVKHESFGRDAEALVSAIRAIRSQLRSSAKSPTHWGNMAVGVGLVALMVGIGIWAVPTAVNWWDQRQELAGKEQEERRTAQAPSARAVKPSPTPTCNGVQTVVAGNQRCLRPRDTFKDCPDCPVMVVVPAGSFHMGSNDDTDDQKPVHKVTITKPLAVGRFEVTFTEWDSCVAAGGCQHKPGDDGWGRGRQPVINVSWNDVGQYVAWLGRKTAQHYRLLSEAEWEYVARAGTKTPYWSGQTISIAEANHVYNPASGYFLRRVGSTVEVDNLVANSWGLHHVHGNVWEWTADCWHKSYQGAPDDGSVWNTGDCSQRVLRGGSWNSGPLHIRSAHRSTRRADSRINTVGFRVARTLTP